MSHLHPSPLSLPSPITIPHRKKYNKDINWSLNQTVNHSETFDKNLMVYILMLFFQKEMENINLKWIDINVFCIVSMSAVLIVSLCPADKESFSDLLQI